jgi:hypothetical protein
MRRTKYIPDRETIADRLHDLVHCYGPTNVCRVMSDVCFQDASTVAGGWGDQYRTVSVILRMASTVKRDGTYKEVPTVRLGPLAQRKGR